MICVEGVRAGAFITSQACPAFQWRPDGWDDAQRLRNACLTVLRASYRCVGPLPCTVDMRVSGIESITGTNYLCFFVQGMTARDLSHRCGICISRHMSHARSVPPEPEEDYDSENDHCHAVAELCYSTQSSPSIARGATRASHLIKLLPPLSNHESISPTQAPPSVELSRKHRTRPSSD